MLGSVGLTDHSPEGEVADFLTRDPLPHETIGFHLPRPRSTSAPVEPGGTSALGPRQPVPAGQLITEGSERGLAARAPQLFLFHGHRAEERTVSRLPCLLDMVVAYGKCLGSVCPHRMQSAFVPHQRDAHIPRGFDIRPTAIHSGRTSLAAHVHQGPNNCTRPYVQRPRGENGSLSDDAASPGERSREADLGAVSPGLRGGVLPALLSL